MPKKTKAQKPISNNTLEVDKPLQYNVPKGVEDSKKVTQKEVFGKTKTKSKKKKNK